MKGDYLHAPIECDVYISQLWVTKNMEKMIKN